MVPGQDKQAMPKKKYLFAVIFLSLALLTACAGKSSAENEAFDVTGKSNPLAGDASAIAAGKTIYENFCLSCHGPAGKGNGPAAATLQPKPADLSVSQKEKPDDYLFLQIAQGRQGTAMTGWKYVLSEEQIWQVLAYIRTLE